MALGKDNTTLPFVLGGHGQTGWGGLLNEPEEESIKVAVMRLHAGLREYYASLP